jgi:C1A family cysteine protease
MGKRIYGLKKDEPDLRDYIYQTEVIKEVLASKIDLRDEMSAVVDQGDLGSCTANAMASGLREFLELRDNVSYTALSRLFLYWHERYLEGTVSTDSGASIRDGMKVLKNIGVCPEVDFPYDISKFTNKPSAKAETDAVEYKISQYSRILSLTKLKASLSEDLPVVFGFAVYESFESDDVTNTGWAPLPKEGEKLLGNHAVLAVGYDNANSVVICRNSWGKEWGDKGYFYLPYSFWSKDLVFDMWTGDTK